MLRLRAGLEGSRAFELRGGASLTPTLALGARHDGGDAETGLGLELGGGLAFAAPRWGLQVDVEGRALVSHEDGAIADRGLSASLAFDPRPDSLLGLSLTLRQDLGGSSGGGVDALFVNNPLADRLDRGAGGTGVGRWSVEAGYGLPVFRYRFIGTPSVGYGAGADGRDFSLGWKLTPGAAADAADLSFGLLLRRRDNLQGPDANEINIEASYRW